MTASARPRATPRLARIVNRLRTGVQTLHRRTAPPQIAMLELLMSGWLSQAVHAAARLGIADQLAGGPREVDDLARAVGANPDALRRLLRALAQHGVFRLRRDGRFAQSPLSETLRREAPGGSVRGFALYQGHAEHRAHWSSLDRAVESGEPVVPAMRGAPFFEFMQRSPAFARVFNEAMTSVSDLAEPHVLAAYDFAPYATIVDVGGGHGRLLAGILARAPHARGLLYDLPEVISGAGATLGSLGVGARCDIEAGSFFERVPRGGDAYVLKHIVHDWDDTRAAQVLQRVREAIGHAGRLVLIESIVPEGPAPHMAKLLDLEMLVNVGGKERTHAEYAKLLAATGFAITRVVETATPLSIIEARPA
ncbi:MAG: methyltransferase [Polyangiales bacterium]